MTSESCKPTPQTKLNRSSRRPAILVPEERGDQRVEDETLPEDFQIALAQELVTTGNVIADLLSDVVLSPWDDSSIEIVTGQGDGPEIVDLNAPSPSDQASTNGTPRSLNDSDDGQAARQKTNANGDDWEKDLLAIRETKANVQGSSDTDESSDSNLILPSWLSDEEASTGSVSAAGSDQPPSRSARRRINKWAWRGLTTMQAIGRLAWKRALTGKPGAIYRRLMASDQQVLIIIVVPSADWTTLIKEEIDGRRMKIIEADRVARTGLTKSASELEDVLHRQKSLVYLTADASRIPPILQASHDLMITVPPPGVDLIRALLRRTGTGPQRSNLDPDLIRSLDLTDLAVAIRPGHPIEASIERLYQIKANRSKALGGTDVPLLSETAAYGEAGDWGMRLAADLADYRRGKISWNDIDRGALIYGPPGTGKTYFARSLAHTCEVPIVVTSAGEWFATSAGHLDSVIKAVRKVFDEARQKAPAILFIDEIDAVPNRATLSSRNGDWWLPVVNDILLLLDNATSERAGVIVIGATNRPEAVDPAILRPGRLERAIELSATTLQGIIDILRHHLKDDLKDIDLLPIARLLDVRSAADLMEIVRSARRHARERNHPLALVDLEAAIQRKIPLSPQDLYRTAVHEAGHAIAHHHFSHKIDSIMISPSGQIGGCVKGVAGPNSLVTRDDLIACCVSLLAGRAAEEIILGAPSIGAGGDPNSDLGQATSLLRDMHQSYGFGPNLIYTVPETGKRKHRLSGALRRAIAVDLDTAYSTALEIVKENNNNGPHD